MTTSKSNETVPGGGGARTGQRAFRLELLPLQ